jgi:CRISPR-associated endonuclease Cas2
MAALLRKEINRVQESVFIGHMEENTLRNTIARIETLINAGKDSIFIIKLCEGCFDKMVELGQSNIKDDEICISLF